MEKQIIPFAVLAYRRMKSLEHDEQTFEATLEGIMKQYTLEEVKILINKKEQTK